MPKDIVEELVGVNVLLIQLTVPAFFSFSFFKFFVGINSSKLSGIALHNDHCRIHAQLFETNVICNTDTKYRVSIFKLKPIRNCHYCVLSKNKSDMDVTVFIIIISIDINMKFFYLLFFLVFITIASSQPYYKLYTLDNGRSCLIDQSSTSTCTAGNTVLTWLGEENDTAGSFGYAYTIQ